MEVEEEVKEVRMEERADVKEVRILEARAREKERAKEERREESQSEWQQGWQEENWEGAQETLWEEEPWQEQEEIPGGKEMPVESYGHHETAEEEAEDVWLY